MSFNLQLLLVALLAAGVLVAWIRSRRGQATAPRGRLRQLAWPLALAAVAISVIASLTPAFEWWGARRWLFAIALAVAIVVAVRPSLARRIVPAALILLGLAGFVLVRSSLLWSGRPGGALVQTLVTADPGPTGGRIRVGAYGVSLVGNAGVEESLMLAQAYLFTLLGAWLTWRSKDPVLARGRLLLGRVTELTPRAQLRTLLLLPVVITAADLFIPEGWSGAVVVAVWIALALGAAIAVVRRWPGAAARLAVTGMFVLGLAGLVLATTFQYGAAPSEYGLVVLGGRASPGFVVAQALVLLAFGAWLAPQAFPSARRLLGLSPDAELTRQVRHLTESRAVAVDTAASDLRRLERDLHDGAQARLVALGMSLRAAERLIPLNPAAAAALVAEARDTSARALTELRELVRGVHPPVLADRGLADAVRALALDCPLAVQTQIDLAGRPPAPVETACYFAVAELLTNAAKHSGTREARVDVRHTDGRLRVEVTDFGLGGADPATGSGLAGVEKRLATFDGIMAVSSPPGGPTIVALEVPCALSPPTTSSR